MLKKPGFLTHSLLIRTGLHQKSKHRFFYHNRRSGLSPVLHMTLNEKGALSKSFDYVIINPYLLRCAQQLFQYHKSEILKSKPDSLFYFNVKGIVK